MRKKLLLALMTLTLTGAAAACPVIPNRAIYGASDMPSTVTPVCDERFTVFKTPFVGQPVWVELYETSTNDAPERFLRPFLTALASRGYTKEGDTQENDTGLTLQYHKRATGQRITMRVFWLEGDEDQNRVYIAFVGRS